jgi:hypothetical protein
MIYKPKEGTPDQPKEATEKPGAFDPIQFLRRRWPYLAGGVVLVSFVSLGLFKFAVSGRQNAQADAQVSATSTSAVATSTNGLVARRLDGVMVKPEAAQLIPSAVMVEMMRDAWPLSGLSKANLVFEAPVEGGVTRLLLVFDASTTVANIGPVRSARPYYVEWADSLHALYAHVGGSPEALNRIGGLLKFRNLDEFTNGKFFWRSKNRAAPHNAYTNQEQLSAAAQAKGWKADAFTPWTYDDATNTAAGDVRSLSINYGGYYNVKWQYASDTDDYLRYQAGKKFKDADGSEIRAKNILVMITDQRVLDEEGRLYVRTMGSGKAILYRNGNRQEVRWSRSPGEHLRIETTDGRAVAVSRGTTWIEVVTLAEQLPASGVSSATSTAR